MAHIINEAFKNELQEIIEKADLKESETIGNKIVNMRGMNVLGVLLLPLGFGDFDNGIYKSWCDGVEYTQDDLVKIFTHFAIKNFDGEIVNDSILELSKNFIIYEPKV